MQSPQCNNNIITRKFVGCSSSLSLTGGEIEKWVIDVFSVPAAGIGLTLSLKTTSNANERWERLEVEVDSLECRCGVKPTPILTPIKWTLCCLSSLVRMVSYWNWLEFNSSFLSISFFSVLKLHEWPKPHDGRTHADKEVTTKSSCSFEVLFFNAVLLKPSELLLEHWEKARIKRTKVGRNWTLTATPNLPCWCAGRRGDEKAQPAPLEWRRSLRF